MANLNFAPGTDFSYHGPKYFNSWATERTAATALDVLTSKLICGLFQFLRKKKL